jgi:hypothetical protein
MSERYQCRRENRIKADGEEDQAQYVIWDSKRDKADLAFPVLFAGKQIWPDAQIKLYVQALVNILNGDTIDDT